MLREGMIFKSCVVMELTENDVDNMFRGLHLGKPGFYHLLDNSSGETLWVTERLGTEVS